MQKTVKTYLNLILHIHSFSKSLPQQKPVIASALLRWAQGWNLVGKKQLKTSEKMDMMWFKRAKSVIQSKSSCISTRHLQHHSGSSLRNGEKNISTYSHIHWNTTINLIESKIRLRNSPKMNHSYDVSFLFLDKGSPTHSSCRRRKCSRIRTRPAFRSEIRWLFLVFLDPKQ